MLVLLILAPLAGCGQRYRETVYLTDPGSTGALIIDVNTFRGNVTVKGDASFDSVRVWHKKGASAPLSRLQENVISPAQARSLDHINVQYGITRDTSGRPLCVVTSITTSPAPELQWVNVEVTAPDVAGAHAVTTHGEVVLINVAGPIDVSVDDGSVILATSRPLADRVRIQVTDGDIDMRITPASTGVFDLQAPNGIVSIKADDRAPIAVEQTEDFQARARLGSGSNSIVLRAYNGDITLTVTNSPRTGTGPLSRVRSVLN